MAILLFEGIVPAGEDIARIGVFFLMMLLFSIAFLAIGIAASAIAKNSTMAVLMAIGFVEFSLLLPGFMSSIADIALGEAPEMLIPATGNSTTGGTVNVGTAVFISDGNQTAEKSVVQMQANPDYTSYENLHNQITGAVDLLSPTEDLTGIARVVVAGQQSPEASSGTGGFKFYEAGMSTPTLGSTLPSILPQVLALLVITIAGFAISYAKFTRMDVR